MKRVFSDRSHHTLLNAFFVELTELSFFRYLSPLARESASRNRMHIRKLLTVRYNQSIVGYKGLTLHALSSQDNKVIDRKIEFALAGRFE